MRFGLILGWLAILKKKLRPVMRNFWGLFFMFSEAKKILKISLKTL